MTSMRMCTSRDNNMHGEIYDGMYNDMYRDMYPNTQSDGYDNM